MKKYNSKIGIELVLFLALIFGFVGFMIFRGEFNLLSLLIFILPIIFIVYLFLSIEYRVENTNLNVKAGFFINQNIDINSIKKISETNNMLSAPAASLDRLEITFGKYGSVIISPKSKKEFIAHLMSINGHIEVVYKKK